MKVNPAFDLYKANPSKENYNLLGIALFQYIQAIIARDFGTRFDELQDAIGETICEILKDIEAFDPTKGNFSNWVYGITYSTCMDMRRRKIRRKEQIYVDEQYSTSDSPYIDKLFLKALKAKLTESEKELVELKTNGISNEEIAQELGTTEGYVKIKWNRLSKKLRTLGGVE